MASKQTLQRMIIRSLDQVPTFTTEEEDREWWATHDLAAELGKDVTEEHQARIRRLKAKYRYVPATPRKSKAA